jgi:hypothetical protein
MWQLEPEPDYTCRHRRFERKHSRELRAVLDNLDTYLEALNAGTKPLQVRFGFIHDEPLGSISIDQKGGGKDLRQTRLYLYADLNTCIVHLITLGDKNTQHDDIAVCRRFVTALRESKDND